MLNAFVIIEIAENIPMLKSFDKRVSRREATEICSHIILKTVRVERNWIELYNYMTWRSKACDHSIIEISKMPKFVKYVHFQIFSFPSIRVCI
mmetsp:Transcript_9453/g.13178  ORF Transcript_9453/g.13178 Transcript_9453/m.13178 type:complete len:93 (+) Transcript_9453:25-303(+)